MNKKQFTTRMELLRHSLNITLESMKETVKSYVSDSNNKNINLYETDTILQEIDFKSYLLSDKIKKIEK
tara:strand:+ start:341 stop:547 length:207 start_codon:yes stop_codon:yes gene_type:complete